MSRSEAHHNDAGAGAGAPDARRPVDLCIVRPTMGQGGADRVTLTLLEHLDRDRFQPTLILLRRQGEWLSRVPGDVPVHDLGGRSLWTAWWPLARLLRRLSPTVLLSTSSGANLVAAIAHLLVGRQGRLVLSERNVLERRTAASQELRLRSRLKRWFQLQLKCWLYPLADCTTAVSAGVAEELTSQLGLPAARVRVVYNPVVTPEIVDLAQGEPPAWPADEAPVVLGAGRLVPAKGFDTLIEALARSQADPAPHLVVLGEGPRRDALVALAEKLGLADRVHLPGFDLNPFRSMARAAVFVLASRHEGLPGALIQAMACGCAVVATDCHAGPAEIVEDGVSGLLIPIDDPAAMAASIDRLLADPGLRDRMGVRARRDVVRRFSLESVMKRYLEALGAVTAKSASSARGLIVGMADLHIGLVGAGHIAGTHLAAWRRVPGCQLSGLFDLDRAAAERRARAFGVTRVYTDLDELLSACDVVGVCTPPATHAELARRVLAAGRNLLIEKPVVTDLADWQQLAGLLRDSNATLAVVHNLKFARGVRQAHRWLRQGRIGRLLHLHRQFLTHPDSDRMLAGRHWSHALPGGRWFETLPHELYLIHHLAGPLEVRHVSVLATTEAPAGAPASEVLVTLAAGERLATIQYSASCRLNRRRLILYGSDGVITVDLLGDSAALSKVRDGRWQRATAGLAETAGRLGGWPIDRTSYLLGRLRKRSPHALLIERFAEHLRGRGESPTPVAEIDYVVRNADLIGREIDNQVAAAP